MEKVNEIGFKKHPSLAESFPEPVKYITNSQIKDTCSSYTKDTPLTLKPFRSDLHLIEITAKIEQILGQGMSIKANIIEEDSKAYEEILKEKEKKLREALKKQTNEALWKQAQEITSYVSSSFSIVAGTGLLASGGGAIAGTLMIASGASAIANNVLYQVGGWNKIASFLCSDENSKSVISSSLHFGADVISSLAGFASGGVETLSTLNWVETATKVVELAKDTAFVTTTVGKGIAEYRLHTTESQTERLKGKEEKKRREIDSSLDFYKGAVKKLRTVYYCSSESFLNHLKALREITIKG